MVPGGLLLAFLVRNAVAKPLAESLFASPQEFQPLIFYAVLCASVLTLSTYLAYGMHRGSRTGPMGLYRYARSVEFGAHALQVILLNVVPPWTVIFTLTVALMALRVMLPLVVSLGIVLLALLLALGYLSRYVLAMPTLLVERVGIRESLERSRSRTENCRRPVCIVFMLALIVMVGSYLLVPAIQIIFSVDMPAGGQFLFYTVHMAGFVWTGISLTTCYACLLPDRVRRRLRRRDLRAWLA